MSGELLVMNFDGAASYPWDSDKKAAFGWAISRNGQILEKGAGLAMKGEGATVNIAEYMGLIAWLDALLEIKFLGPVEIRGDSQLVIFQVSEKWKTKAAHLRALRDRAAESLAHIPQVNLIWIPREQNKIADQLSVQAMKNDSLLPLLNSTDLIESTNGFETEAIWKINT